MSREGTFRWRIRCLLAITASCWEKVVLERVLRLTWSCILPWFGIRKDCHAHMDPIHLTTVIAAGQ